MMGIDTCMVTYFAPDVDMIAGSELPPFYTAWFHSHPVHNWRLLGKNVQATTEIKWRQNDTAFNSDGSYIYSHHVYSDDGWHISGLCKCWPRPIKIFRLENTPSWKLYTVIVFIRMAYNWISIICLRLSLRHIGLLQWLAMSLAKIIIYSWTVQKAAC